MLICIKNRSKNSKNLRELCIGCLFLQKRYFEIGKKNYLGRYIDEVGKNCRYSAFLIHMGTWQLLRKMPTYIKKKHYHFGKKVADVGFVWHPDTLFQANNISV